MRCTQYLCSVKASVGYKWLLAVVGVWLLMCGCSSTKHVPQGKYLLDDVTIVMDSASRVRSADLVNYLRQTPNHKVLGFWKLQLGTYNLSGRDSTRWYNRWLQRLGQPPVVFDTTLTAASRRQLEQAMINRGYLDAHVKVDTSLNAAKRKAKVEYHITPGEPHKLASLSRQIPDTAINNIVERIEATSLLREGDLLNLDNLDAERTRITNVLRNRGYYDFKKDYIGFVADTVSGSHDVALTMIVRSASDTVATPHNVRRLRHVVFITNYRLGMNAEQMRHETRDSISYKGMDFIYGKDKWITPGTLEEKCFLQPGALYSARQVDMTYEYLSRLPMVKSINIELTPAGDDAIDAYILLTRNRLQSITFDVEGTNSEGDLGFGVGLTYQHRNLGHRSRVLTVKFRAGYESLSGNLDGLINDNYQEYTAEAGITFPKFEFPFVSGTLKKRLKASTEVALQFNYQARPEYTRVIAGGVWRYRWNNRPSTMRHTLDLLNINYVYLPKSTNDFLDLIAPDNPLLRYSYEDHFIVNIGYSYYRTNRRTSAMSDVTRTRTRLQPSIYTFRVGVETAGNVLYGLSKLFDEKRQGGVYKLFGIQYSQYAKSEIEYAVVLNPGQRHSLAFRAGGGIGIPYGNSTVMPFEKRFYAGGANNVRGWGVRTLGPGAYDGTNSVTDFINQCGDISMIMSAEYRFKLFWVLEAGVFVDAGNIWTIRNYPNQPGGVFKFDKFYKQIAAAYGLGIRMDFNYFLLRFDLGMKAHNPAEGREPWPLIHPRWHRDATFHFAVGYPF